MQTRPPLPRLAHSSSGFEPTFDRSSATERLRSGRCLCPNLGNPALRRNRKLLAGADSKPSTTEGQDSGRAERKDRRQDAADISERRNAEIHSSSRRSCADGVLKHGNLLNTAASIDPCVAPNAAKMPYRMMVSNIRNS